jgi:flagellar biosynthesis protein FlhB
MKILPTSIKEWFGFVSFVIKVCIVLVCLAVWIWCFILNYSGLWPYEVVKAMRGTLTYILGGYLAACVCLIVMGVVERFWQRRKQSVWDFVFAGLALFCLWLLAPLTCAVK